MHFCVRRDKAPILSGCEPRPATVAPAGSSRSGWWRQQHRPKHFDATGRLGRLSDHTGHNASERHAGLETRNAEADPPWKRGRLPAVGKRATRAPTDSAGVLAVACVEEGTGRNTGSPAGGVGTRQRTAREGQVGPVRVAERSVVTEEAGQCRRREGTSGGRDGEREQAHGSGRWPITPEMSSNAGSSSHAQAKGTTPTGRRRQGVNRPDDAPAGRRKGASLGCHGLAKPVRRSATGNPRASRMIPLESPVPEIGTPGSESGGRKRAHGVRTEARCESAGRATAPYRLRASPRLYTNVVGTLNCLAFVEASEERPRDFTFPQTDALRCQTMSEAQLREDPSDLANWNAGTTGKGGPAERGASRAARTTLLQSTVGLSLSSAQVIIDALRIWGVEFPFRFVVGHR